MGGRTEPAASLSKTFEVGRWDGDSGKKAPEANDNEPGMGKDGGKPRHSKVERDFGSGRTIS